MKTGISLLLQVALCQAAVIQPREAQAPVSNGPVNPLGMLTSLLGPNVGPLAQQALSGLLGGGRLGGLAYQLLPEAKLAHVQDMKPQLRNNAKRQVLRFGPQTLTGKDEKKPFGTFSLDPHGQSTVGIISKGICSNCTILAGRTGVVFEDGSPATPAQGIYVHHILSVDLSKQGKMPVSVCDFANPVVNVQSESPMQPASGFIGQGEDNGDAAIFFTNYDGSYNSGFHIKEGDKFLLQTDLVNYNTEDKKVYVTFDLEYVDGIVGADAVTNLISVTGCKIAEPKLNQTGPAETKSQKFPILEDGHIVSMKGHMHNGGENMVMMVNGKVVCTSKPTYDTKGQITAMSGCDKPIAVFKGDTIEITSRYDLSKHALRSGANGGDSKDRLGGHDVMGYEGVETKEKVKSVDTFGEPAL